MCLKQIEQTVIWGNYIWFGCKKNSHIFCAL